MVKNVTKHVVAILSNSTQLHFDLIKTVGITFLGPDCGLAV